jgi:hypothetical protein
VASSQFDATYDLTQIQGHELSISATRTELASGSSTAVMNNASAYLPVAEKHLQMAESDYTALGGSVSSVPGVNAGTGGLAAIQLPSLQVSAPASPESVTAGALGVPGDPAHVGWWMPSTSELVIDGHVDMQGIGPGAPCTRCVTCARGPGSPSRPPRGPSTGR